MFSLKDKVAVVTGAARGIGRSISLALADAGADLALIDLLVDNLQGVRDEIEAKGRKASIYQCDITDPEVVAATFNDIAEQHGALHILVNNAGMTRDNLLIRLSPEDWEAPIRINLTGTFYCTKAAVRFMMKQRYGRTKSTAKELASREITANAIAPGFIATAMTADLPANARKKLTEHIPLGRLGKPEDVAPAVVFLASEEAGYITGQTLPVDGGMVI